MTALRASIAYRLRCIADRIDRPGAPKATHVRFTFEDRIGIVFRDDGHGCRLWYYGDEDYERAHTEAGPVAGANSTAWLPRRNSGGYADALLDLTGPASARGRIQFTVSPDWTPPPPDCPVTGWPQIDRDDLDMCSCGHRHIKITAFGPGSA